MERAIKTCQTLETGLQIASDLLTDSVHSRNPILRRPTNRRVCIRLYANKQKDLHVAIIAAGARLCATWRYGCQRVHLSDTGHRPSSVRLASRLSIGICNFCYACAYPNDQIGCVRCVRLLFPIIGGEVAQPPRAMYCYATDCSYSVIKRRYISDRPLDTNTSEVVAEYPFPPVFSVRLVLIYEVIGLWFSICGGFYLLGQELLELSYTISVHRTICIRRLFPNKKGNRRTCATN